MGIERILKGDKEDLVVGIRRILKWRLGGSCSGQREDLVMGIGRILLWGS